MDDGEPISYLAIATGTPVLSASGTEFGTVERVLQIVELDEFDGIAVKTKKGLRYVGRARITDITTTHIGCDLTDEQIASLPAHHGQPVLRFDPASDEGPSLKSRFARLFRRSHWKELD